MIPKKKRIINKELLASYHNMPCIVGKNCYGEVSGHHWVHKGAGGDDVETNIIPMCLKHHSELHQLGRYTFSKKYDLKKYSK